MPSNPNRKRTPNRTPTDRIDLNFFGGGRRCLLKEARVRPKADLLASHDFFKGDCECRGAVADLVGSNMDKLLALHLPVVEPEPQASGHVEIGGGRFSWNKSNAEEREGSVGSTGSVVVNEVGEEEEDYYYGGGTFVRVEGGAEEDGGGEEGGRPEPTGGYAAALAAMWGLSAADSKRKASSAKPKPPVKRGEIDLIDTSMIVPEALLREDGGVGSEEWPAVEEAVCGIMGWPEEGEGGAKDRAKATLAACFNALGNLALSHWWLTQRRDLSAGEGRASRGARELADGIGAVVRNSM